MKVVFLFLSMFVAFSCSFTPTKENPSNENNSSKIDINTKDYPVLLVVDPKKNSEPAQKAVLFAAFNDALSHNFTIVDGSEIEQSSLQKYQTTGTLAATNIEDYLFEKYNKADICVYLWAKIEDIKSKKIKNRTYYRPTIECRIVDLVTHKSIKRLSNAPDRPFHAVGISEDENKSVAMKKWSKQVAQQLAKELTSSILSAKFNFVVEGILFAEDYQKLKVALQTLADDKKLKFISTVLEAEKSFKYEIASKHPTVDLISYIKEAAAENGCEILVRATRRKIQISSPDQAEDD